MQNYSGPDFIVTQCIAYQRIPVYTDAQVIGLHVGLAYMPTPLHKACYLYNACKLSSIYSPH